jgi:hypothetical protein
VARRILGPNPYEQAVPVAVPPLSPKPANPQDIMAWGVENAPNLFAQAREADRRMRAAQASQEEK